MSIPKNHHYVSQCHIRNFFNNSENKIYLYDKKINNFFASQSTKSIFSEEFSNSTLYHGKVNHKILEDELRINFENDFHKITDEIKKICSNPCVANEEQIELLYQLSLYGLIGEMRNPQNKKRNDDELLSVFNRLKQNAAPNVLKQLDSLFTRTAQTKYSNVLAYTETAIGFLKRMGELDFTIYFIKSSDLFLLPDTTSFHIREKINT